jgi:hypothetical protein
MATPPQAKSWLWKKSSVKVQLVLQLEDVIPFALTNHIAPNQTEIFELMVGSGINHNNSVLKSKVFFGAYPPAPLRARFDCGL